MMALAKGQRWRAYPNDRPARQVYISVTRVARDGTWADLVCCTWAALWHKRQPLRLGHLPFPAEPFDWAMSDLSAQEMDWEAARRIAAGEAR